MVGGGNGEGARAPPWTVAHPNISIPSRASMGSGGAPVGLSPGPMTLLSNFFGDNDECKSFSELLAGAMVEHDEGAPSGFSPMAMFTVPPGLSPAGFLHSPPPQGHFGVTRQQAIAQVPAATSSTAQQLIPPSSLDYPHSEQRLQSSAVNVDKPNDDGYNWRKYGQKQVKGCEFPRSYYKCTHPSCPVKKKVERSLDGHVNAIIYKGEHNHQCPNPSKLTKNNQTSNQNSNMPGNLDSINFHPMSKVDPESSQATVELVSGTSDGEEVGDHETEVHEKNDEPDPKRRNTEVRVLDHASSHRTVSEPRIIVQTTSEVDLLEDGYRWRKYGQKVVKGNPYPRSYYKCTTPGCNVRKHVERVSTDPKAVMTTYEGKHNHEVPAAKTNSHTLANSSASQLKSQNAIPEKHSFNSRGVLGNEQQPVAVARLMLKEEQIT